MTHEWELTVVGLSWAWVCSCGVEASDFASDAEAADHATLHEAAA